MGVNFFTYYKDISFSVFLRQKAYVLFLGPMYCISLSKFIKIHSVVWSEKVTDRQIEVELFIRLVYLQTTYAPVQTATSILFINFCCEIIVNQNN